MKTKWLTKLGALALSAALVLVSIPAVFADGENRIKVKFTDVTETDLTTLSGEAKVLVSVEGAGGNATIAQTAFTFEGDLKYKSIRFLKGKNDPPEGFWYNPNSASANADKSFLAGIVSRDGLAFGDDEELFIITFAGEAGKTVTLKAAANDSTYCTVDGADRFAEEDTELTLTASSKENAGKKAVVKLTMDKVLDFSAAEDTGITLTLTGEKTEGYTVYSVLNNTLVSKGGHRESTTTPTFTVENTVLADETYTVELSGIGYVPYKKSGVSFDEALSITNADFIPGDVNADGKVDGEDKKLVEGYIADSEYSEAADFNRDGKVNARDLAIFPTAPEATEAPAKMAAPTLTGGNKKITVKWTVPSDDSITGYVIRYGMTQVTLN